MSPARVPDTGPREGRSGEWGPGNLGSHCGGLGSSAQGAVMWWCEVPVRERGNNHHIVDVEALDMNVEVCSRPLLVKVWRSWTCLNVLLSFLRHAHVSNCMFWGLDTRSATLDGEKLCLSISCTYPSDLSFAGRAIDSKFDFSDSAQSVSCSRMA